MSTPSPTSISGSDGCKTSTPTSFASATRIIRTFSKWATSWSSTPAASANRATAIRALAYAIIENQRVELQRIEYPVEETVRTVWESSLPEPAKAMLAEVFRTGGIAKPDSSKVRQRSAVDDDDAAVTPTWSKLLACSRLSKLEACSALRLLFFFSAGWCFQRRCSHKYCSG